MWPSALERCLHPHGSGPGCYLPPNAGPTPAARVLLPLQRELPGNVPAGPTVKDSGSWHLLALPGYSCRHLRRRMALSSMKRDSVASLVNEAGRLRETVSKVQLGQTLLAASSDSRALKLKARKETVPTARAQVLHIDIRSKPFA